jgi:signal transduction histidine kinase
MSGHRATVERLYDAYNTRRFDLYAECFDEDVLLIMSSRLLRGARAVTEFVSGTTEGAPGVQLELEQVLAESCDSIVVRARYFDASSSTESEGAAWGVLGLPFTLWEAFQFAGPRVVKCRNFMVDEVADQLFGREVASLPDIAESVAEQAALRRVATLVARGPAQNEVFDAIVTEAVDLLGQDMWLLQYRADHAMTIVASHSAENLVEPTGKTVNGNEALARTLASGRPIRVDRFSNLTGDGALLAQQLGVLASAMAPLIVQGALWGALMLVSRQARLPVGIEGRLAQFADLAATAVANAQSQAELALLTDEQTALRRVAELVAHGAAPEEVFDQVTIEASRLLDGAPNALERYEHSGSQVEIVAVCRLEHMGTIDERYFRGARIPVTGDTARARVWRTQLPARVDDYAGVAGVETIRLGARASVAAPVVVEGRLWGVLTAGSPGPPLPGGTEDRLARFCDLVAAAIANAENRAELTASRTRIVASGDEARRRLARDVHDGAQQRLVHSIITLKQAQAALETTPGPAADLVDESLRQAQSANRQLRELAHGIMPASLQRGGLHAGVESLRAHVPVAVRAEVLTERLPGPVETTAYFVIAEALTNVAKHAAASQSQVRATLADGWLIIEVSDNGRGGADPAGGSGLIGLADRVAAAGGKMSLTSPQGMGTTLSIAIPASPTQLPDQH